MEWYWILVGIVVVVALLLLLVTLPDIARYMRMRRM